MVYLHMTYHKIVKNTKNKGYMIIMSTMKRSLSVRRKAKKKDKPTKTKQGYDKFKVTHRDILVKDERKRLLLATEKFEEIIFIRIGLNSGLRLQEILDLEPRDFIYEENQVRVRNGKGGKARWACIDSPTLQIVKAFVNELKLSDDEKIFLKSNRSYQYMIERVAHRAKIKRIKVTPHILRHTNITMLLCKKMPIEQVKEHAGHEHISTTEIYTHLDYDPVKETYMDIMGE